MKVPTSLPRPNWRQGPLARAGALLAGALLISAIGGWSRRSQTEVAPPSPDSVATTIVPAAATTPYKVPIEGGPEAKEAKAAA